MDYDRAMYGTGDLDGLGVKAALDLDGPPLDPDAELDDAPTTEPHVRAYLRERFPALEHAPLAEARACRYELSPDSNFIAGTHPEQPASGCSAAAPATASSTARRWPSGWPRRIAGEAPLPDRFALGPRSAARSLRTAGVGCENLTAHASLAAVLATAGLLVAAAPAAAQAPACRRPARTTSTAARRRIPRR